MTTEVLIPSDPPAIMRLDDPAAAHQVLAGPTVLCVGTFDGVHRGHQEILRRGRAMATAHGLPLWVLSFHPHPKSVLHPDHAPGLLTEPDERVALFAACGADGVVMVRFDAQMAGTPAERFADETIAGRMQAAAVIVGADFGFGKGRSGDAEFLQLWGQARRCPVEVVGMVPADRPSLAVSSSLIRRCLEGGEFDRAVGLLGHPYPVSGRVKPGAGRGRQLGYPTWNLTLSSVKLPPPVGVYAGWSGQPTPRPVMAYFGINPTFGEQAPRLEVHVLDSDADAHTPRPAETVWLSEFLRPEIRFPDAEALKRQLAADEQSVRTRLANRMITHRA